MQEEMTGTEITEHWNTIDNNQEYVDDCNSFFYTFL